MAAKTTIKGEIAMKQVVPAQGTCAGAIALVQGLTQKVNALDTGIEAQTGAIMYSGIRKRLDVAKYGTPAYSLQNPTSTKKTLIERDLESRRLGVEEWNFIHQKMCHKTPKKSKHW